jgi:hypothetical protein
MPNSGKNPNNLPGYTNKSILSRAGNYLSNAAKETSDFARAWKSSADISGPTGYPEGAAKQALQKKQQDSANNQQAQMGQALGAILQGRRYDKNGKQIKK